MAIEIKRIKALRLPGGRLIANIYDSRRPSGATSPKQLGVAWITARYDEHDTYAEARDNALSENPAKAIYLHWLNNFITVGAFARPLPHHRRRGRDADPAGAQVREIVESTGRTSMTHHHAWANATTSARRATAVVLCPGQATRFTLAEATDKASRIAGARLNTDRLGRRFTRDRDRSIAGEPT